MPKTQNIDFQYFTKKLLYSFCPKTDNPPNIRGQANLLAYSILKNIFEKFAKV